MQLTTSVAAGSLDKFQAAFSRSVLGVTVKKYKRKGSIFWKNKEHNQEITRKAFEYIYLLLKDEYKDSLKNIDVKINYTIGWDETQGRILYFKDVTANCYLQVCNLYIDKLELKEYEMKVNMNIFYSEYDRGSKDMLGYLDDVLKEYDNLIINKEYHKVNDSDYEEIAKIYGVEYVPTVVIDDIKIEPLSKNSLREKLNKYLDRKINPPNTKLDKNIEPIKMLIQN